MANKEVRVIRLAHGPHRAQDAETGISFSNVKPGLFGMAASG
jgi:hypothetical protein